MATREGYAQVAWRMSTYPELAIVRRFKDLNLQNVLYLQAELTEMEDALRSQEEIDRNSPYEMQRWNARSWKVLQNGDQDAEGDGEKWKMFLRIREKLVEYSEKTLLWRSSRSHNQTQLLPIKSNYQIWSHPRTMTSGC